MKASRWLSVFCVVPMLALTGPSVLRAANWCLSRVQEKIDDDADALANEGFAAKYKPLTGQLSSGKNDVVTLRLTRGTQYGLVGVCDQDCSHLDLALYDADDSIIAASNVRMGNHPVIYVTPQWTGEFKLSFRMTKCGHGTCYYGISVFGR